MALGLSTFQKKSKHLLTIKSIRVQNYVTELCVVIFVLVLSIICLRVKA